MPREIDPRADKRKDSVAVDVAVGGKKRVKAEADTLNPADDGLDIALEVSDDGGVTWREIAYCTGAVPYPALETGAMQRPGFTMDVEAKPGRKVRTVVRGRVQRDARVEVR